MEKIKRLLPEVLVVALFAVVAVVALSAEVAWVADFALPEMLQVAVLVEGL